MILLMNYKSTIENLPIFLGKAVKVEPLKGGVTNANFKVIAGNKKYVASFGFESNKFLGVDRKREAYNYGALRNLGVAQKLVKYYPKQNLLLTEYIEGKVTNRSQLREPKNIAQIARILRKVHTGKRFKGVFDPYKISRNYFELVKGAWIPVEAKGLLNDLELLRKKLGLVKFNSSSHLDLVPLNILINKGKISLLDWEYSAMSDYRFDLAQLSSSADYEPKHDKILIKAYGRKELTIEQLNIAKAIMLIREIGWDLVQNKYSKLNFDYKKYALGYIKRYQRIRKQIKL
jgi:thiamine kinase-like enzyme